MKIYKYIYYYSYLKSRKKNPSPEIPVYTRISFDQVNNMLTLINIFFSITKSNISYDMPKCYLIIFPLLCLFNSYYFGKKGNGAKIIKDSRYSLGKYSFILDVYSIISILLVGFSYYLYKGWV
jgi:hypothetical protein